MIIKRNKYFSEEEKKKKKDLDEEQLRNRALITLVGGGGLAYGAHSAASKYLDKSISRRISKNEESVTKKILEEASKRGIGVERVNLPEEVPAAYLGSPFARALRAGTEKLRKYPKLKELIDKKRKNDPGFDNMGKDLVVLSKHKNVVPEVLGHEVGHAYHSEKDRPNSPIGRVAHKLQPLEYLSDPIIMGLHGMKQGYKRERDKAEGKKSGFWTKHGSVILPAALNTPKLIAEAAASSRALKLMKKHGADIDTLNRGKKNLAAAYGTHLAASAIPVVAGLGGNYLGRVVGKNKFKNSNKKKKDDSKKE